MTSGKLKKEAEKVGHRLGPFRRRTFASVPHCTDKPHRYWEARCLDCGALFMIGKHVQSAFKAGRIASCLPNTVCHYCGCPKEGLKRTHPVDRTKGPNPWVCPKCWAESTTNDEHQKTSVPDPEGENENRSRWAATAIIAFRTETGSDHDTAVQDLIADIGHFCDRHGLDLKTEVEFAAAHYVDETGHKGKQFDW